MNRRELLKLLSGGPAVLSSMSAHASAGIPSSSRADSPEASTQRRPFLTSELIFPLEHWHNHASCIVQLPTGDLFTCWYHGSGERQADDVIIQAARKPKGSDRWEDRFTVEDVPGYPDANPAMFVDPRERLWLLWPTIMANEWHTALMKYRIVSDYQGSGPPDWDTSRVMHFKPGDKFLRTVEEANERIRQHVRDLSAQEQEELDEHLTRNRENATDKLYRRMGWMTRAHPYVLSGQRLIVPLYSDGFSFSLMAISDDWGETWSTSTPLVGLGNIQPSIARRTDGTLVTYMRDNGPPPKRLLVSESTDDGETWSPVRDSEIPNPGSGAEVTVLENGNWALVYNDTEEGRHSLAISISDDEGQTWKWKRHLELDHPEALEGYAGEYGYPSIIQASDGTLHVSYSYFAKETEIEMQNGRSMRKSIKHAHFNEDWVRAGGSDE